MNYLHLFSALCANLFNLKERNERSSDVERRKNLSRCRHKEVQTGEQVLIVTDYAKTDIAKAVASVACDRGGEVMVMSMKPRKRCGRRASGSRCSSHEKKPTLLLFRSAIPSHTLMRLKTRRQLAHALSS